MLASLTDWLDGFLARRLKQESRFGEFLDPVADKLMIAVILVLIVSDQSVLTNVVNPILFSVVVAIIISREIAISALREWVARVGFQKSVSVNWIGKIKTLTQMIAVTLLLFDDDLGTFSVLRAGEILLYIAGTLTLWSMFSYLKAAWPALGHGGKN